MNELTEYAQSIIDYLRENGNSLNVQSQQVLGQLLQNLLQLIEEGSREPQIPTQTPQLEPGPFPSSNVNSFKYDPDKQQLYVKFHGQDSADSGPTYSYQGVPQYIFNVFAQGSIGPKTSGQNQYHRWIKGVTPSLGGTMNALIKAGGFPYQRLS